VHQQGQLFSGITACNHCAQNVQQRALDVTQRGAAHSSTGKACVFCSGGVAANEVLRKVNFEVVTKNFHYRKRIGKHGSANVCTSA
jgi:tRNA A37 threonylcarbamoyltransferase TsaD